MEKYFKFPSKIYPSGQIGKWYQRKEGELQEDMDEVDRLIKESLRQEGPKLTGREIECNIAMSSLESCYFEPCASIEHEEEEFETGNFSCSSIYTRNGDSYIVLWPVKVLEQKLKEAGVIAR